MENIIIRKATKDDASTLAINAVFGTLKVLYQNSSDLYLLQLTQDFSRDLREMQTSAKSTERVDALRAVRTVKNADIAKLQGKRKRLAEKLDIQVLQSLQIQAIRQHLQMLENLNPNKDKFFPYADFEHLHITQHTIDNNVQGVKYSFRKIVYGNTTLSDADKTACILNRYFDAIDKELKLLLAERDADTAEIADASKAEYRYSDAMDLYMLAYDSIASKLADGHTQMIDIDADGHIHANNTDNSNTLFPYVGKEFFYDADGKRHARKADKTRTVYQAACADIRAYIGRQNKDTQKRVDLSALIAETETESDTDTENGIDACLYNGGLYHTTDTAIDAIAMREMLAQLDLTHTQYNYIMMRLSGLADADIAEKRNVDATTIRDCKRIIVKKACAVFDADTIKYALLSADSYKADKGNSRHKRTDKDTVYITLMRNMLDTCFYADMPHFCKDTQLDAIARAFYKGCHALSVALADAENRAKASGKMQTAFPLVTETESGNKPCATRDALPIPYNAKLCKVMSSVYGRTIIPLYASVFPYRDAQVNTAKRHCNLYALYAELQAQHIKMCKASASK